MDCLWICLWEIVKENPKSKDFRISDFEFWILLGRVRGTHAATVYRC